MTNCLKCNKEATHVLTNTELEHDFYCEDHFSEAWAEDKVKLKNRLLYGDANRDGYL